MKEAEIWFKLCQVTDLIRELFDRSHVNDRPPLRSTLVEMKIMGCVISSPEGCSVKELAERLKITPGAVSQNVEKLVRRGPLVRLPDAEGRIAAEGALPYPPGVLCVVPGEIWGGAVLRYFSALEEGINLLPGFAPELQGVYIEEHDGRKQVWCYVIKPRDAQSTLLKGEKL